MPITREQYDADLIKPDEPTEYETEQNQFELPCGACGRLLFVDRETLDAYAKSFAEDADNLFVCSECERDYEAEAAFE